MNEMTIPEKMELNGERVLTTAQIAEMYGTDSKTIHENFRRNKERYTNGEHFYCLTGKDLKAFKNEPTNCGVVKTTNKLYLWTEKGALLHAKSLSTDKAWETYAFLLEHYFRVQEVRKAQPTANPSTNYAVLQKYFEQVAHTKLKEAEVAFSRATEMHILQMFPEVAETVKALEKKED
ncbi:MAG: ORF6N domain-containing protein [Oscillospiraceae bacterium]